MLTIGEVAKKVEITIGAIRFYERKGLLKLLREASRITVFTRKMI